MWIYLAGSSAAPILVDGDWTSTTHFTIGDVTGNGRLDLVTRTSAGHLFVHDSNGSTVGNPWTSRRSVGTGWNFTSDLML